MAAAYAALNSVMFILQQIQHHPRPPITIENQQMESLCEIISFFQDFLEKHSHRDIGVSLESQIADAAYAAEDIIESHIVDQILPKSNFHEENIVDQILPKSNFHEENIVDPILPKSNFHEENNCINLLCRGVKKLSRNLACCTSHKTDQSRTGVRNLECSTSHKTDQILTGDRERSSNTIFCQDLQKVIEDMNLIKKEVIEIQEKMKGIDDDQLPRNITANIISSSTVPPLKRKHTNPMVGFDDVLEQIMDRLTGHPPNRQVLPIVGMGGIGKTTLARNVYDYPTIVEHFHIRIWVTISQEYRLRDILLEALSSRQKDENKRSEDELGDQLYKSLCGRRYLIVLDDMWSIEAWEKLMSFFPDNKNGSRILITTRLSNVSNHFGSWGFKMNFLDEDKSWDLFCKFVFPQDQCCPHELEETGKKIARNCKGLPLSIIVIGGLLANSEKTQQHWKYVAENLNSIVNLEDDKHCLNVLALSFNHLPIHLKPCFLYVGVYPEDSEIRVSQLRKLWVAEGFLKPIASKSLEEVAEEYLKDLIDRNLILVHKLGNNGKVKYCKIHDLLRDLCLREGERDKFLWVRTENDLEGIQSQRRISIHEGASKEKYQVDTVLEALQSASFARSLKCHFIGVRPSSRGLRLVRVFNCRYRYYDEKNTISLEDVFKLMNARYLDFITQCESTFFVFRSSMHQLWNLQTLIITGDGIEVVPVPPEIWVMSQLRHIEIDWWFSLPDPPNVPLIHEGDDDFILRNLHTLKTVVNFKLSEEVIKRIPNIKKLEVNYSAAFADYVGLSHNYCLNNLGLLNKLESLYWTVFDSGLSEFLQNFAFPNSLKKLTLMNTDLHWEEDMRMIGSLPHLQVLKLKLKSFKGAEWNPVEGEFLSLKFLLIDECDLVNWNADRTHFPCLEKLFLIDIRNLEEIPLDFGEIPTLGSIELLRCNYSTIMSTKNLSDEQVDLGNEDLQVQVTVVGSSHTGERIIEMEKLATHNFQVIIW